MDIKYLLLHNTYKYKTKINIYKMVSIVLFSDNNNQ